MNNKNLDDYLEHSGVLGMRWGIRKDRSSASSPSGKKKVSRFESEEHSNLRSLRAKTGKELSDAEIKTALARLRLEKEYKDLTKREISGAESFVKSVVGDAAKETAKKYTAKVMSAGVEKLIKAATKKT